jgi:ribonuclease BN (tRNA processing enzyme)
MIPSARAMSRPGVTAPLLLALLGLAAPPAPPVGAQTPATHVILLGTGTPYPDPARQGPATAVTVGDRFFLFDAGPGVMRQINAAGLPRSGPEALFVTHLHSDHTLGYPDLLLTSWVMRRAGPFDVIGPPGLRRMTDHLLAAWEEDIRIRTDGLEAEVPGGHLVDVREVAPADGEPEIVYDRAGVTVRAIRVRHGSWDHAFAYRVDTPDRSILITGDLAPPFDGLIAAARGVDVLVSEVYPAERVAPEDRPGGHLWPEYMRAFHTSGEELGALAEAIGPGTLVLTHVIWSGGTVAEIESAIRRGGFHGPVVVGEDLERY